MNDLKDNVATLRELVERHFGATMRTPADFKRLKKHIDAQIGVSLSTSTLMRVWGYVTSNAQPNAATLNTLARYVGLSLIHI